MRGVWSRATRSITTTAANSASGYVTTEGRASGAQAECDRNLKAANNNAMVAGQQAVKISGQPPRYRTPVKRIVSGLPTIRELLEAKASGDKLPDLLGIVKSPYAFNFSVGDVKAVEHVINTV
ncbi:MAG TPA: hypothetical protein VJP02_28780 [Candidatus Sulfotelmatobacter sp.]|nr:hypothetical protein [Candidatus Sulfotelmatobacter sp.]